MVLFKFILLSIANVLLRIFGLILVPLGVLITPLDKQFLPKWLNWYNHQLGFITKTSTMQSYDSLLDEKLAKWGVPLISKIARIMWLWRNQTDMFNYLYGDYVINEQVVVERGEFAGENLGDREGQVSGSIHSVSSSYFEFYSIKPYKLFNKSFCIRTRIGWKLTSQGHPRALGERAEWVLTINPIHPYRGL